MRWVTGGVSADPPHPASHHSCPGMSLFPKPLPNPSQPLPNPSQFKCCREQHLPPGPARTWGCRLPAIRNAGKPQEPVECGVLCSPTTPDPAGRCTWILPTRRAQGRSRDPGMVGEEGAARPGIPDLGRFPPSPHRAGAGSGLGTAWVEPGCSLTPFQGRAVFIFGNIKAQEEVIKLKNPARFREPGGRRKAPPAPSVPGSGTRPRPRSCHRSPAAVQEVFP